jgi:septum formation topological specificity factor MinE
MSSFFKVFTRVIAGQVPTASASARTIAKDRLAVMLVHQRNSEALANVDMESLKKEVAEVVERHFKLAQERPTNFSSKCSIPYIELLSHTTKALKL